MPLPLQQFVDNFAYGLGLIQTQSWRYYASESATPVLFEAHQIKNKKAAVDEHRTEGNLITLSASASSFDEKPGLGFLRRAVGEERFTIAEVDDQGSVNYFFKIGG